MRNTYSKKRKKQGFFEKTLKKEGVKPIIIVKAICAEKYTFPRRGCSNCKGLRDLNFFSEEGFRAGFLFGKDFFIVYGF